MQATEAYRVIFLDRVPRVWLFEPTAGNLEWLTPEQAQQRGLQPKLFTDSQCEAMVKGNPKMFHSHSEYYGRQDSVAPPPGVTVTPPAAAPSPQSNPEPVQPQTEKQEPTLRERVARAAKDKAVDYGKGAIASAAVGSLRPWITAVYVLLLLGVVAVCAWNIMPYEVFVRGLLSRFELSQFGQFFANNPIAIWIAAGVIGVGAWKLSDEWIAGLIFAFLVLALGFSNLYSWLIGTILWAVIQAIELLPIVMSSNQGYLRAIIKEQETHEALRIDKNDDGLVRAIKKGYNSLPMRFLIIARRLRIWVYLLDLCICIAVYPPITVGGIDRLFYVLSTGLWGLIDWGNIVLLFATLLAVEVVFKVLIVARNFLTYLKTSKPKGAIA